MILRKKGKPFRMGNGGGMMVSSDTRFSGPSLRVLRSNPKVQTETIPKDQRQYLSQDEIRNSGVLDIMEEVFVELYQVYLGRPLSTDTSYLKSILRWMPQVIC